MIIVKNDFVSLKGYFNDVFEVPLDENVISVYIYNNYQTIGGGSVVINGLDNYNGYIIYFGKSLLIKGLTDQMLIGKLTVKLISFPGQYQTVGIMIKRRIYDTKV